MSEALFPLGEFQQSIGEAISEILLALATMQAATMSTGENIDAKLKEGFLELYKTVTEATAKIPATSNKFCDALCSCRDTLGVRYIDIRNERDHAMKDKKLAVEKIGSIKADTKVQIDKAGARMEMVKYEVDKAHKEASTARGELADLKANQAEELRKLHQSLNQAHKVEIEKVKESYKTKEKSKDKDRKQKTSEDTVDAQKLKELQDEKCGFEGKG